MERRDVLLARLDFFLKPGKVPPRYARGVAAPRGHDWHSRYDDVLKRIYPQLENISVDYAILEPATRGQNQSPAFVLPAAVGWSDIGSWQAVFELLAESENANVSAGPFFELDAAGNFLWSPKKFIAAIGIRDLVVVDTEDALLICPRERAQEVGGIVKWLESHNGRKLL